MRCNAFPVAAFPSTGVEGSPAGLYLWADQAQSYFPFCLKVYICEQTAIIFSSLLEGGSGRSHTRWSADLGRSVFHISTAGQVGSSLKIRSDQIGSSLEIRTFEICDHSINLSFTNRDDTRMRSWKSPSNFISFQFNLIKFPFTTRDDTRMRPFHSHPSLPPPSPPTQPPPWTPSTSRSKS